MKGTLILKGLEFSPEGYVKVKGGFTPNGQHTIKNLPVLRLFGRDKGRLPARVEGRFYFKHDKRVMYSRQSGQPCDPTASTIKRHYNYTIVLPNYTIRLRIYPEKLDPKYSQQYAIIKTEFRKTDHSAVLNEIESRFVLKLGSSFTTDMNMMDTYWLVMLPTKVIRSVVTDSIREEEIVIPQVE